MTRRTFFKNLSLSMLTLVIEYSSPEIKEALITSKSYHNITIDQYIMYKNSIVSMQNKPNPFVTLSYIKHPYHNETK